VANKNIKEVEGGETATINDDDGFEIDTGAASLWVKWSTIKSLIATYYNSLTATLTNKTLTTPTITGANWDGWALDANTWSYSSADSPTFVISVNADMTALIGVGDRIKLTQTTAKYFIVTAMGAYSAGATLITVYGGTDYTLANAAITAPYYSHAKYPFGFPATRDKWTVTVTDTGNAAKATPTANTWYGGSGLSATGISVSVPIGSWIPSIKALIEIVTPATSAAYGVRTTLSTANNSESDATWTTQFIYGQGAVSYSTRGMFTPPPFTLDVASKTTHYINILTGQTSVSSIAIRGDVATTAIKLICAYL